MFKKALKKFIDTYLQTMRKWEKKHPVINTLIVVLGVILIWRGVFGLLDQYLFPDNPLVSNIVSLAIGFAILLLDDFELDEL